MLAVITLQQQQQKHFRGSCKKHHRDRNSSSRQRQNHRLLENGRKIYESEKENLIENEFSVACEHSIHA